MADPDASEYAWREIKGLWESTSLHKPTNWGMTGGDPFLENILWAQAEIFMLLLTEQYERLKEIKGE